MPFFGRFGSIPVDISMFDERERVQFKTFSKRKNRNRVMLVSVGEDESIAVKRYEYSQIAYLTVDELVEMARKSIDTVFVVGSMKEMIDIGEAVYAAGVRKKFIVLEETEVVAFERRKTAHETMDAIEERLESSRRIYGFPGHLTPYDYLRSEYHPEAKKAFDRGDGTKSALDAAFFIGMAAPIGEAFVHAAGSAVGEDGKTVIVLDVNSMFPWAMTLEGYSNPAELIYDVSPNPLKNGNGIYKVVMRRKPTADAFPESFFHIRYANDNSRLPVRPPESFATMLHWNEIAFWEKYYDIEVIDGVFSKTTHGHPLSEKMVKMYEKRSRSSGTEKKIVKSMMVMASSLYFKTFLAKTPKRERLRAMREVFGIEHPESCFLGKYFSDESLPDILNPLNVNGLVSQMYAFSNEKLLSIFEKIYFSGLRAEIAYANIDSVHVIVPNENAQSLLSLLSEEIGASLGKLKVEAIGDGGIWADTGKYIILKDGEEVKSAGLDEIETYGFALNTFRKKTVKPWKNLSIVKKMENRGKPVFSVRAEFKEVTASGGVSHYLGALRAKYLTRRVGLASKARRLHIKKNQRKDDT